MNEELFYDVAMIGTAFFEGLVCCILLPLKQHPTYGVLGWEANPRQNWIPACAGMTAISDFIGPRE